MENAMLQTGTVAPIATPGVTVMVLPETFTEEPTMSYVSCTHTDLTFLLAASLLPRSMCHPLLLAIKM